MAQVSKYQRTWYVISQYDKTPHDWLVAKFVNMGDFYGELWMNNVDGYVVLIEQDGTILKSDI